MTVQPPEDLLTVLRHNLRRIEEEHRDEDLTPAARELKRLLLRRIEIIETAMQNLNDMIKRNPPVGTPPDSDE